MSTPPPGPRLAPVPWVPATIQRDATSASFYDALAEGVLLLTRCVPRGHVCAPNAIVCPWCASLDLEQIPAKGTGTVVTWGVAHSRSGPDGTSTPQGVLALVELDEGPWLHAALVEMEPRTIQAPECPWRWRFAGRRAAKRSTSLVRSGRSELPRPLSRPGRRLKDSSHIVRAGPCTPIRGNRSRRRPGPTSEIFSHSRRWTPCRTLPAIGTDSRRNCSPLCHSATTGWPRSSPWVKTLGGGEP